MNTTCTIITADFLHYALALHKSLNDFQSITFYILITDVTDIDINKSSFPNLHFIFLDDVKEIRYAKEIIEKYRDVDDNALRWSLKPILAGYLLKKYEKVLILDADLFFCNDFQFLFDELDSANVLLTPHWRNSSPSLVQGKERDHFEHLFVAGLYNAGFFGINRFAENVLFWWANCCLYRCDLDKSQGHYGDQTYLNLMPIYFEKVRILKHRGCNISEWNYVECERTLLKNGELGINNKYPVVFIHFAGSFVKDIESSKDPLSTPYFKLWKKTISEYKEYSLQSQKSIEETESKSQNTEKSPIGELDLRNPKKDVVGLALARRIKRKVRIRTRIRRFLDG